MSTESIDIQKYLWQNIRLGEGKVGKPNLLLYTLKNDALGTFAHMHTRFFVTGVSTQIRDQPNHLYDINTE
jgi:hypothetical protein